MEYGIRPKLLSESERENERRQREIYISYYTREYYTSREKESKKDTKSERSHQKLERGRELDTQNLSNVEKGEKKLEEDGARKN